MIIAVLNVRLRLDLTTKEVYLNVAGGLKITDPASDLAVAVALISATINKEVIENSIYFGEIGLSGEIRKVNGAEIRIKKAKKLGFNKILCSNSEKLANEVIFPVGSPKELRKFLNC